MLAKNNLRKISGIASALLVVISLTGCVSYEEIYGRVVDKSQNSDTTMMMVGEVMIPMINTNYDLTVEYKKEGSLTGLLILLSSARRRASASRSAL